jgi:multidrug efflux pump subunit AcrA (membrane-fusion protein)
VGGGGAGGGGMSEFMLLLQDAVKPGSRVKKGDVVAEFDRQFMLQRLDDFPRLRRADGSERSQAQG